MFCLFNLHYFISNPLSRASAFFNSLFTSPDLLSSLFGDSSFLFRFNSLRVILNSIIPSGKSDLIDANISVESLFFSSFGLFALLFLVTIYFLHPSFRLYITNLVAFPLLLILFIPLLIFGPIYISPFWFLLPHTRFFK